MLENIVADMEIFMLVSGIVVCFIALFAVFRNLTLSSVNRKLEDDNYLLSCAIRDYKKQTGIDIFEFLEGETHER